MSVLAARRSIGDIMYTVVALSQPPVFKPVFPGGQDPVFNRYPGAVTGHAALMNDLGTGPNHGLLQQAAILLTAGAKTDVSDSTSWTPRCAGAGGLSARWLSNPRSRLGSEHQPVGVRPGPGCRGDPGVRHASDAAPSAGRRCGRDQRGAQQPRHGRGNRLSCQAAAGQQRLQRGQPRQMRYGPDTPAAVTPSGSVTWQGAAAGETTRFPAAQAGRPGRG